MKRDVQQAFLAAYDDYADAIFRHCYFRVFRKSRAEELTQEAFMKTWEYLAAGNQVLNIRAFLYRVANNLIIDESRKAKEASLENILANDASLEPADNAPLKMEQALANKEILETLHALSAADREIITLRYMDDLDPKEIAEILNISANAVSVRIHRALAELKKLIPDS